jgi:ribonuclease HI
MAEGYFDGSCAGNPCTVGGIGWYLKTDTLEVEGMGIIKSDVGVTNNQCEYLALIRLLEDAVSFKVRDLDVRGDSQLVIRQVRGEYTVNNPTLLSFKDRVIELSKLLNVRFTWVPREHNRYANDLSQRALKLDVTP